MPSCPMLTVGMPVYNAERFIANALDSFLGQTFKDFELLISDNASTDRTEEICRQYAARDQRIRYFRNAKNMGAGWNFRRVYSLANGKYYKSAAHDDMIQPDFLRLCLDALEADDSLVLAHSLTRVIDENGQFIENYNDGLRTNSLNAVERARDLMLRGHRCYPIFGVIRLDALHKLPPLDSCAHSDRVLLLRLGLLGRFYEVPQYLFISTSHLGQSVWTMPERTKAKGLRLTRRHGTLPALEWWDPAKARKIAFPEWNAAKEFLLSVAHSPLDLWQRLRCYGLVARWMLKYHRRMAKDLLIAADQVLFNFQNRRVIATKTQSYSAYRKQ